MRPSAIILFIVLSAFTDQAKADGVWRLKNFNDHFYTNSCQEANIAQSNYKYLLESYPEPAFNVETTQLPDSVPLYRFFDGAHHFYSLDKNGRAVVPLRSEGILGYIYTKPRPDTVPLLMAYNPSSGDHFYTVDKAEHDRAVATGGYQNGQGPLFGISIATDLLGFVPSKSNLPCRPERAPAPAPPPRLLYCPLPPECYGGTLFCVIGVQRPGGNCTPYKYTPCGICGGYSTE